MAKARTIKIHDQHMSVEGSLEPDEDGWYTAKCACGYERGVFPDLETLVDELIQHAREMGYLQATDSGNQAP